MAKMLLIHNYGLFWRKPGIHWGRGKNPGHLKGTGVGEKTGEPVDFREQQGVYCLYDENFRLVYVGQAGGKTGQRLFARLKQHREDAVSERWTRFSWFGVRGVIGNGALKAEKNATHPDIGDVLNHIEAILIAAAEPVHNRQGGRFGESVGQYLQFRDDDNLGPERDDMIREIWKKSKSW